MDLLENEELKGNNEGSGFSFNPNVYGKLILGENEPEHVTPLVDWLRALKGQRHWVQAEKKFKLCAQTYGKDYVVANPCKYCNAMGADGKPDYSTRRASTFKMFPVYTHSRFGKTRVSDKDPAKTYIQDCLLITEVNAGENNQNLDVLEQANTELLVDDAGLPIEDHEFFYENYGSDWKRLGKKARIELVKERLDKCGLLFTSSGADKVYEFKKVADPTKKTKEGKTKMSYPPPALVDNAVLQRKLGPQAKIKVPKKVREHFENQSLQDLAPFYFSCFPDADWVYLEANGINKPEEGQRLTLEPEEMGHKVEASSKL